mgnify:CR=1 FL=1
MILSRLTRCTYRCVNLDNIILHTDVQCDILKAKQERKHILLEIQDNIQWHPAFCSAMELELREYKEYLTYEREHNLGKMPLKKASTASMI